MSKQNISVPSDIIGAPISIGDDVVFYGEGLKIGIVSQVDPLTVEYLGKQFKTDDVYVIYEEDEDWPDVCIMEEY